MDEHVVALLLPAFIAFTAQNLDSSLFLPRITGVSGQHCMTFMRLPSRLAPPTILDHSAAHITLETFSCTLVVSYNIIIHQEIFALKIM